MAQKISLHVTLRTIHIISYNINIFMVPAWFSGFCGEFDSFALTLKPIVFPFRLRIMVNLPDLTHIGETLNSNQNAVKTATLPASVCFTC